MNKLNLPSQHNLKKGDIRIRFFGLDKNLINIDSCLIRMGIITNVGDKGYDLSESVILKNQPYESKEPLLFLRRTNGKLETISASHSFDEKFSSFLNFYGLKNLSKVF
ncbi:MAG: hypothetical protein PHH54_02165 [Candidatus Nanoarchaeia archaeon]|nr:hypothetical protein [Candidatus Nanoarchaeia archaeon]MDD5740767.1 hypothetical protein [Candidatus Nanoarchaeia archaeon]